MYSDIYLDQEVTWETMKPHKGITMGVKLIVSYSQVLGRVLVPIPLDARDKGFASLNNTEITKCQSDQIVTLHWWLEVDGYHGMSVVCRL